MAAPRAIWRPSWQIPLVGRLAGDSSKTPFIDDCRTDAFGVVNFITLSRETNEPSHLIRATRLVETVHDVLGCTRDGRGRLPGASDANPLGGGLRIGKEDADGADGDGQYHHYLTLWMFALNRLAKATRERKFNDQAIALAKAIHPHFFLDRETAHPRMVWKIAMDMSRPLVFSQGNLDPIDGLVVFRKLAADRGDASVLRDEIADYERVIRLKGKHFVSSDTLDLGMTLWTSHWLAGKEDYFSDLQRQAKRQVASLLNGGYLDKPTARRLAFREYGTCLGIGCLNDSSDELNSFRTQLIATWEQHLSSTPGDLRAISEVMRAAALIPGAFKSGYLGEESHEAAGVP